MSAIPYSKNTQIPTAVSTKKTAAVIGIGITLLGTGSFYEMTHAEQWLSYVKSRVPFEIYQNEVLVEVMELSNFRTVVEHIENIRSILNISISELANLCDVSRQAIYKWLAENSTPEQEKFNKIIELSRVADQFREAGISRASSFLRMKIFGEYSLLDLLVKGKNTKEYTTTLINEIKAMELSYNQSGLSSSKTKPTNDWRSSISIPGSPEKD